MRIGLISFLLGCCYCFIQAKALADNGIRYNYGEFRLVADAKIDDINIEGDGFAFAGSYRLDELFYLTADYEVLDYDDSVDTEILQVGAGIIMPYQSIDTIAEFSLLHADFDSAFGGDSDTGFRVAGGARAYLFPNLELRGTLNYLDVDGEDDTFATFAADYFISKVVSVNVSKDISADTDRLSIGVRYYFGD